MYSNNITKSITDHLIRNGYKWSKDQNTERILTVRYLLPEYDDTKRGKFTRLTSFTSEDKRITEEILDKVAKYTGLEFRLVGSNESSNLTFACYGTKDQDEDDGSYTAGFAYYPAAGAGAHWCSSIWIYKDQSFSDHIDKGVLLHEILHALGLEHFDKDQDEFYTGIMRPMIRETIEEIPNIDILALRELYGPDKHIRAKGNSSDNSDIITKNKTGRKEQQRETQEEQNQRRIAQEKQEQYKSAVEDDSQATQGHSSATDAYTAAMVEYVASNITRAGNRWNNNAESGKGVILTYSYLQQGAFSAQQRAVTEEVLQKYAKCADITFMLEENNPDANITFSIFNYRNYLEREEVIFSSASFNKQYLIAIAGNLTDENFTAILNHKVGHAMGLDHIDVPTGREDVYAYTAMSPWGSAIRGELQPADKLALQKLYGQPKEISSEKLFNGFFSVDDIYEEVLYPEKENNSESDLMDKISHQYVKTVYYGNGNSLMNDFSQSAVTPLNYAASSPPADVIIDAHQQANNTEMVNIVGQQYQGVDFMA